MTNVAITFGFPEFWPKAHGEHKQALAAIASLADLANEIFHLTERIAEEPVEKVVYVLTRATSIGMNDVIMLCGNGSGPAGMKISRGMFESSTVAEYLRRNPKEAEDYVDFGHVLFWRRQQWLEKNAPEELQRIHKAKIKAVSDAYDRVKAKFTNANGRVRNQWSVKSIGQMAEEIGRRDQYELPYSLGSSMHHVNAEGMLAYIELSNDKMVLDAPPSEAWVTEALIAAHTYFLMSLGTLNEACKLGFDDRIDGAVKEFGRVWRK